MAQIIIGLIEGAAAVNRVCKKKTTNFRNKGGVLIFNLYVRKFVDILKVSAAVVCLQTIIVTNYYCLFLITYLKSQHLPIP
jgi:hypothetical protein